MRPAELKLDTVERAVLDALDVAPRPIDAIVAATGLNISQVLAAISVLETRRLAARHAGNQVSRTA